jgi:hypothetical protein
MLPLQNGELLPKNQIFQAEVAARTARSNENAVQELKRREHKTVAADALSLAKCKLLGSFVPPPSGKPVKLRKILRR